MRLGPRGSVLRRARLGLLALLLGLLAFLAGPFAPWWLPGDASLVPRPGQSRIHTVLVAMGYAAAATAVLCILLLATARGWARPGRSPRRGAAPRGPTARVWVLLLAAAALAGALRWPLASRGVWWDEAWSLRHTIVGRLDPAPEPEPLRFREARWLDTLWSYRTPTNHVAYSVVARASLAAWRALAGAERHAFDERALRLPAWLAALGAVVGLGLLVHGLGLPAAAPAAALLLAIHPWHLRYGADGRGYSFVVLLAIASALCLLRALREDRWRWWLAGAASQALLLWTFPLAVYVPLALGAAAVVAIAAGPREERGRLARFAVAELLGAMAFLQIMAPNLAQAVLLERLLGEEAVLDWRFARQLWVAAATGLHVRMPPLPELAFPTLTALAETRPWLPIWVYGVLPLLAAAGALRIWRRGGAAGRAVIVGLTLAPVLLLAHRAVDGFFAYPRFAIHAVVPTTALLAAGCEGLLRAAGRPALVPLGLALGLAGYQAALWPLTQVLLRYPHAPSREIAAFLAARDAEQPGGIARAGAGLGGDVIRVYDPWVRELEEAAELVDACARSRREGRPLYVHYGYNAQNHRRHPALMALLDDARLFERVAFFPAIESEHAYRVLRYTGAAPPAGAAGTDEPGGREG
jgi:hypothetical protein